MKIPKPILLLLAAFVALAAFAPRAQADGYDYFYDTLDPYGQWVQIAGYGYCWQPATAADPDWAPYTDGYWAYTDDGWTWVSYEDYGGITYHYGRWMNVVGQGWYWVPGTEWAPAWVSWRSNDDYVGWAPLPPEAEWQPGTGFSVWVDAQFNIGPGYYSFVDVHNFGAPALRSVIIDRRQNTTFINNTTNITNITVNNNNVFVGGPRYAVVAAKSTRPIQTLKLVRQSDSAAVAAAGGKTLAHAQGYQLMVLSPKITAPAAGAHLQPPKVAKTIAAPKRERGWGGVTDPAQRQKLQAAIKKQAHGATPSSAPAHSMTAEETSKTPAASETVGAGKGAGKGTGAKTGFENQGETAPGIAAAGVTPKLKKGKGKKGAVAAPTEAGAFETEPAAEATPARKLGKSKKGKTPAAYEDSAEATPRKTKGGETDLQPFMGGGGEPVETKKTKKPSYEGETGASGKSGYGAGPAVERRTPGLDSGGPAEEATPRVSKKGEKKGAKGEPTPPF